MSTKRLLTYSNNVAVNNSNSKCITCPKVLTASLFIWLLMFYLSPTDKSFLDETRVLQRNNEPSNFQIYVVI